jgi:translation elongation factor EF-1alpha
MGEEHWYKGPTLLQAFDEIELPQRQAGLGLRIPVVSCFRDEGINIFGKVESGTVTKGQKLIVLPAKQVMEVTDLYNTSG